MIFLGEQFFEKWKIPERNHYKIRNFNINKQVQIKKSQIETFFWDTQYHKNYSVCIEQDIFKYVLRRRQVKISSAAPDIVIFRVFQFIVVATHALHNHSFSILINDLISNSLLLYQIYLSIYHRNLNIYKIYYCKTV